MMLLSRKTKHTAFENFGMCHSDGSAAEAIVV